MNFHNDFDHFPFIPLYPWVELQYHWDWTTSDLLAGEAATPSYAHLPQAAEIPLDQETVGLPGP